MVLGLQIAKDWAGFLILSNQKLLLNKILPQNFQEFRCFSRGLARDRDRKIIDTGTNLPERYASNSRNHSTILQTVLYMEEFIMEFS